MALFSTELSLFHRKTQSRKHDLTHAWRSRWQGETSKAGENRQSHSLLTAPFSNLPRQRPRNVRVSCGSRLRQEHIRLVQPFSLPTPLPWPRVQPVFFGPAWLTVADPVAQEMVDALDYLCDGDYLFGLRKVVPGFRSARALPPLFVSETLLLPGFTDADVCKMLTYWLQSRGMPIDDQTFYALFVPPGIVSADGNASGRDVWMGSERPLRYFWITDTITVPEQRTRRDAYTTHLSRELVELCADPEGRGVCPVREAADGNDWATRDDPGLCLDAYTRYRGVLAHTYWLG